MIGGVGQHRSRTALDPVTLEVIRNALPAITNEMSCDLQRTSYNMMLYGRPSALVRMCSRLP
jgi:hypothetical protein